MKWLRCTENSIRSDDDRYKVSKAARWYPAEQVERTQYDGWGPKGSQRVDYIAAQTVKTLVSKNRKVADDLLALEAGRAHLGTFDTAEEAKGACEQHAARPEQEALAL